jgi:dephospho-CoA kinase
MTKKLFAITGGIGSGKSSVLAILKDAGYKTLSSDQIVSELYKTHKVKCLIKEMFPSAVSGEKRLTLNRAEISKQVFVDKNKHALLTNAITPLVLDEILKKAKRTNKPLFVEVPLLFECDYQNYFDGVIVVTRDKKARIESVKMRSNLTEEQILARIKNQVDYDALDKTPYTIINNDGDILTLKEKVLKIAKELTE